MILCTYVYQGVINVSFLKNIAHVLNEWSPRTEFKVCPKLTNEETRTKCEVCSKLPIKLLEQHHLCSEVFIINFEKILRIDTLSLF